MDFETDDMNQRAQLSGNPTSWQVLDKESADRFRAAGHVVSTYEYNVPGHGNSRGTKKVPTWVVHAKREPVR